jgi:ribose 5-phosphate isomerase B
MRIGIAADHAGFALKKELTKALSKSGHEIVDFGPSSLNPEDDYPEPLWFMTFFPHTRVWKTTT